VEVQERGMVWSGVDWSGAEWNGEVEWGEMEWSGVEWSGVDWSGVEWSGAEWSGMEWNGVEWINKSNKRGTNAAIAINHILAKASLWQSIRELITFGFSGLHRWCAPSVRILHPISNIQHALRQVGTLRPRTPPDAL
jgi:hypothetical protein